MILKVRVFSIVAHLKFLAISAQSSAEKIILDGLRYPQAATAAAFFTYLQVDYSALLSVQVMLLYKQQFLRKKNYKALFIILWYRCKKIIVFKKNQITLDKQHV